MHGPTEAKMKCRFGCVKSNLFYGPEPCFAKLVLLEAVKKSSIFGNIKESMTISKIKTKRDIKKSSIFGNIKESMTISKTKTKRDTKKSSISKKIKESMTFSKYNIKKYNIIKKSNHFFLSPYINPQSGTSILFAP